MISRRALLASPALLALSAARSAAEDWGSVIDAARGQTVYFNAWAGDGPTNAFIAWAAERVRVEHAITLRHVRLADTSEAVARVVAERAAGRLTGGSVDIVWINGPNFVAMKRQGLLAASTPLLPNAALVDHARSVVDHDFGEPVDGLEVPWRLAQVVFVYDRVRLPTPPRTMSAMADWATAHPGRLTHPRAGDFLGATFLKQALVELAPDRAVLQSPPSETSYAAATTPLWAWYDRIRPHLWRGGREFPADGPAQAPLLADGAVDLFISFNPAEAALGIAHGTLPDSVRAFVPDGGSIANCSFVAIPFNAAHRAAALVLADFLLSPEAQAHAADPTFLGTPTVLDLSRLPAADRAAFDTLPHLPGLLTPAELGRALPEPHAEWMSRISADWERRVAA